VLLFLFCFGLALVCVVLCFVRALFFLFCVALPLIVFVLFLVVVVVSVVV